uniref:SCP domain-containing protein n=1 Tax=Plectus sambesii TaxID=2011161 RepID=A0A914XR00_9BILA
MVESNNMLAMMWDQSVADGAQQWADCCSNSYSQASGVGETIYVQTGGAMDAQSNYLAAVTAWWSELTSAFAYNSPFNIYPGSSSAHNFTQLAWARTYTVGCGFAKCTNNIFTGQTAGFVVCRFSSQGNIAGQPIYNPNPGVSCNSGATCSFASQSSTCDSRGLANNSRNYHLNNYYSAHNRRNHYFIDHYDANNRHYYHNFAYDYHNTGNNYHNYGFD